MKKIIMKNERDTQKYGHELAKSLKAGSVIALIGALGTGKTALTKAIAEGMGIKEMITSPTFTIVQEYHDGRLPLYHFDVYRICDIEEMYELGYEEYFYGQGVCIVEWADLISDIIPEDAIKIHIEYGQHPDEREFILWKVAKEILTGAVFMNILAIETTGANASVAIINEDGQIFTESSSDKLNHLQHLIPMTDQLLEKCRLTLDDVTYIAASEGPGSFTGIRIGVSTARALAQAKEIDTISVPTLKSFLYHEPEYRGIICPIFDARRSQVYGGAYQWAQDGSHQEVITGDAYDLTELLVKLERVAQQQEIMFFGDGIDSYQKMIMDWSEQLQTTLPNNNIRVIFAKGDKRLQNATSIARLALELYKTGDIKSYHDLKPVYMRKAEAERKLEANSK